MQNMTRVAASDLAYVTTQPLKFNNKNMLQQVSVTFSTLSTYPDLNKGIFINMHIYKYAYY